MNFVLFLVILNLAASCIASPGGAPQSACDHMTPGHDVTAQEGESPFNIVVSKLSVEGGEIIDVEIQTTEEKFFKGFLLMARTNEETYRVLGEFLAHEDEETPFNFRTCREGENNAVTHFNNNLKEKIKFKWRAPEGFAGTVRFR